MNKNLIVKLPESVDKDLYRMGEIRLRVPNYVAGRPYSIMYPKPLHLECNIQGAKENFGADGNFVDNINPSGNKGFGIIFPTNGTDAVIRIWGIEKLSNVLTFFSPYEVSVIMPNAEGDEYSIDNFKYLPNNIIRMTYRGNYKIHGDIKAFKDKTSLIEIILDTTSVSGDISALKNLTALTAIGLNTTSVSGDILALDKLTKLTVLKIGGTSITGDIKTFADEIAKNNVEHTLKINVIAGGVINTKATYDGKACAQGEYTFSFKTDGTYTVN